MNILDNIVQKICVALASCLVLFPIIFSSTNFWDGAILSYAVDSRNLKGLSVFVTEAGYHFTSIFALGAIFIAEVINQDYFFIHKIFSILIFLFLTREIRFLTINSLNFTKKQALITYLLVCIFPIWHLLQTSAIDYFFFFVALGLLGVRYFDSKKKSKAFLGFLLIIASFQVGSMLIFALALHIVSNQDFTYKISKNLIISKKSKILIIASLTYWVLTKVIFEPSGVYRDYNSLFIPNTFQDLMKLFSMAQITFGYLSIFGLSLLVFFVFKVPFIGESVPLKESIYKQNIGRLEKSFFLFASSLIPYLAVGKVSSISAGLLESRFLLLLCITIPIVLVSICISANDALRAKKVRIRNLILAFALAPYLFITIPTTLTSHIYFLNQQIFTKKLFNSLNESNLSIPPGLVLIESSSPTLDFNLSIYDSNYQLWKLFDNSFFWSSVVDSTEDMLELPNWVKSDPKYFYFFASSPPPTTFCETRIKFTANGFSYLKDRLQNISPFAETKSNVVIDSVDSVCPSS